MSSEKSKQVMMGGTNSMITAFAVLIAIVAVFFAGMMYAKSNTTPAPPPTVAAPQPAPAPAPPQVSPDLNILQVRDTDAVKGSGDILLVEYSDYECGFCKRFHPTVQALVDSGEVAWVYRHLPLPFHVTAKDGAAIAECVKTHKGVDAFWTYTDGVFAEGALNLDVYKSLGRNAGLSDGQIDACLAVGSNEQRLVEQHMQDAQKMGVNGTPGSFLVNTKTQAVQSIPGALPLEQVRGMLSSVQ